VEAETLIWPEMSEKFPLVPMILVALKCDVREDNHEEEEEKMDSARPRLASNPLEAR